jgi:hypothetical protein
MAEPSGAVETFFWTIVSDPVYLVLTVGGIALLVLLIIARHIHRIRKEDIFVHQAWGANWKGR